MNEIERMLNKENAEKKRIARGDFNKKRGGGKTVRFPSDYLTKKEREAMNGEVFVFDPRCFYDWQTFKKLPDEHQLKWVNSIINRYDVGLTNISTICFGLSKVSLTKYLKAKGLSEYVNSRNSHSSIEGKARLICDVNKARHPEEEPESKPDAKPEENEAPKQDDPKSCDLNNIAILLQALVGTGAKLTIEVVL